MQSLLTHVAGVDVHKDILVITVLRGPLDQEPEVITLECSTFSHDLEVMGTQLLNLGVEHVAMESTGIYWKPIYNVWHPMGLVITVANASHVKNVPGRKTDVKDSHWLAQLHRCGLIRSSFIPETEFQQLRLLNRHRTNLVEDLARVKNRVHKILEDGNIKLGSVVSDLFCPAGMAILDALSQGITDEHVLLTRARQAGIGRLKQKEQLHKALSNAFREDHCFLIRQLMKQYVDLQQNQAELEAELEQRFRQHANLLERLDEIPGVDQILAQGILAEASTQLESFQDDRQFAAWAGVAPGNHESARKKKDVAPDMVIPPYAKSSSRRLKERRRKKALTIKPSITH